MSLQAALTRLSEEFAPIDYEVSMWLGGRTSQISSATDLSLHEELFCEGALSRYWQAWCDFCRTTICSSCLGTTTAAGVAIGPHPDAHSEAHVSEAARRAKKSTTNPWGRTNSILRLEVTWGDTDTLATIVPRMLVPRHSELTAAFSQADRSAKALQIIRNAAAHHNIQTMANVVSLSSRFISFPVTHPIQALFWTQTTTGTYLIQHAVHDLLEIAEAAVA